jgi:hypothetical protein
LTVLFDPSTVDRPECGIGVGKEGMIQWQWLMIRKARNKES